MENMDEEVTFAPVSMVTSLDEKRMVSHGLEKKFKWWG